MKMIRLLVIDDHDPVIIGGLKRKFFPKRDGINISRFLYPFMEINMKIRALSLLLFLLITFYHSTGISQPLSINWQQCYGGNQNDFGDKIIKAYDGYYLLGGTSSADGNVPGNHGGYDFWLIHIDTAGNILWSKTYGGIGDELDKDIKRTPDGGFMLFGESTTISTSGQVTGNHGGYDFWLAKTDSIGNFEWGKCLGGSCNDIASQIIITPDSGYIFCGMTCSADGDVAMNYGGNDSWVVRLDKNGNIKWEKTYGGPTYDAVWGIQSTSDGGVILGGVTSSTGGNISCSFHGEDDCWLAKLDSLGNIEWQKCYGGTLNDGVGYIIATPDSGYLFTASSNSDDGEVTDNHGNYDIWVVKVDHWGNLVWQKCFGGSQEDKSLIVRVAMDNNYLIGGFTHSNDGDVYDNHSLSQDFSDGWLIKVSKDGNLMWQKCFGGFRDEAISDIIETTDSKLMILGYTNSADTAGDVYCTHHGIYSYDVWLLSVSDTTTTGMREKRTENLRISAFPSPADDYVIFRAEGLSSVQMTGIRIFNSLGQKIDQVEIGKGPKEFRYECAGLRAGYYFFQYENKETVGNGRFIVLH
jgi:hypothetical protein